MITWRTAYGTLGEKPGHANAGPGAHHFSSKSLGTNEKLLRRMCAMKTVTPSPPGGRKKTFPTQTRPPRGIEGKIKTALTASNQKLWARRAHLRILTGIAAGRASRSTCSIQGEKAERKEVVCKGRIHLYSQRKESALFRPPVNRPSWPGDSGSKSTVIRSLKGSFTTRPIRPKKGPSFEFADKGKLSSTTSAPHGAMENPAKPLRVLREKVHAPRRRAKITVEPFPRSWLLPC